MRDDSFDIGSGKSSISVEEAALYICNKINGNLNIVVSLAPGGHRSSNGAYL